MKKTIHDRSEIHQDIAFWKSDCMKEKPLIKIQKLFILSVGNVVDIYMLHQTKKN